MPAAPPLRSGGRGLRQDPPLPRLQPRPRGPAGPDQVQRGHLQGPDRGGQQERRRQGNGEGRGGEGFRGGGSRC